MTMNTIPEFAEPLDLSGLLGRTVDAYSQGDGYWHASVALRAGDGAAIVFTTAEHSAGHWFEVFPIRCVLERLPVNGSMRPLAPVTIVAAAPLWRFEWIEPGAIGPTLGSRPNTQYAGRGPIPSEATSAARVLAGLLLADAAGRRIVVASSDSAPFNVEIARDPIAINTMLEGFELGSSGR